MGRVEEASSVFLHLRRAAEWAQSQAENGLACLPSATDRWGRDEDERGSAVNAGPSAPGLSTTRTFALVCALLSTSGVGEAQDSNAITSNNDSRY